MTRNKSIKKKLIDIIKVDVTNDVVKGLMKKFDDEIIPFEDEKDPMRPSVFREEFEKFLRNFITETIRITNTGIKFEICDDKKLGFDEELDEETTDGIRIIGTIIQGISGEYVLVTIDMAKDMFPNERVYDLGRTGRAYLMSRQEYDQGVKLQGWKHVPNWRFSNFPGVSNFFNVDLDMDKYIKKALSEYK
jgi:hypothetical protein